MPVNSPQKKSDNPVFDISSIIDSLSSLLKSFKRATITQKGIVVAMGFFLALGVVLMLMAPSNPPWALVFLYVIPFLVIFASVHLLALNDRSATTTFRCRDVPIYPLKFETRSLISGALKEIREDAFFKLQSRHPGILDTRIRANIFLLVQVEGGNSHKEWRLIIPNDFAINMNHPPERDFQFNIGQGATGIAYKNGNYQLTRRQSAPQKEQWDRVHKMTPELEKMVHNDLKWIVSFPLLKPGTSEALGVLNIDGLVDVPGDIDLNDMATYVRSKIESISQCLSLEPSICVGNDQLGVIEDA
jgi:hypothetical protein